MQKLTPIQELERKRLIAGIHIKKQELGMGVEIPLEQEHRYPRRLYGRL